MNTIESLSRQLDVLQAQVMAQGLALRAVLEASSSGVIWLAHSRLLELHDRVLPEPLCDAALLAIQTAADELVPLLSAAEARDGLPPRR